MKLSPKKFTLLTAAASIFATMSLANADETKTTAPSWIDQQVACLRELPNLSTEGTALAHYHQDSNSPSVLFLQSIPEKNKTTQRTLYLFKDGQAFSASLPAQINNTLDMRNEADRLSHSAEAMKPQIDKAIKEGFPMVPLMIQQQNDMIRNSFNLRSNSQIRYVLSLTDASNQLIANVEIDPTSQISFAEDSNVSEAVFKGRYIKSVAEKLNSGQGEALLTEALVRIAEHAKDLKTNIDLTKNLAADVEACAKQLPADSNLVSRLRAIVTKAESR